MRKKYKYYEHDCYSINSVNNFQKFGKIIFLHDSLRMQYWLYKTIVNCYLNLNFLNMHLYCNCIENEIQYILVICPL